MIKFRLDAVADAVFGIVLTILVLEVRVPEIQGNFTEARLIEEILDLGPLFFAYFLSFIILVTQWYTHNFLYSLLSKNVNRFLMNLNFIYLALVSLIPFSTHLLGSYPFSQTAVFVYACNIAILSILNWYTRNYIYTSPDIGNPKFSELKLEKKDILYGSVRIWINLYGALLAVALSFINTYISLGVLLLQAAILITPGAVATFTKLTGLEKIQLNPKWKKYTEELVKTK